MDAAPYAITADHILVDGGEVLQDGLVLIADGKILKVGLEADLKAGLDKDTPVVDHEGWLSAGLVAANGTMGLGSGSDDSTSAFTESLLVAESFNGDHSSVTAARSAGVTSFGLTTGRANVAGGQGSFVKTQGAKIVNLRTHLTLCMGPPAIQSRRYPTSYSGAVDALEKRFAAGEGAFGSVTAGKLGVTIAADARHEIDRAIRFCAEAKLSATLRGAERAGEFADRLAKGNMTVVMTAPGIGSPKWHTDSLMSLAEAGVPFAFGLADSGAGAGSLRLGASLAVRAGLDRATAWRAITSTAATLAGGGESVGRVAVGFDADLALWSGDPLSPTTRLESVYIDGALITEGN
ncbi:MAG: imidazolonepropionase-like amidohydrolase [Planctomycetota bacterium]|jgi:imidazolonepropionase-like amidohydrolase